MTICSISKLLKGLFSVSRRFIYLPVTFIALSLASVLDANDAGLNEGVEGPMPLDVENGEESKLRMASEELKFRFSPEETHVNAKFEFHNTDDKSTVTQLIGFPDIGQAVEHGLGHFRNVSGPLRKMKTRVDGVTTESVVRSGRIRISPDRLWLPQDDATTETGYIMAWYTIDVVVPPSGRVTVERDYITSNGAYPYFYDVFEYVTHTGAGWAGTSGSLLPTWNWPAG